MTGDLSQKQGILYAQLNIYPVLSIDWVLLVIYKPNICLNPVHISSLKSKYIRANIFQEMLIKIRKPSLLLKENSHKNLSDDYRCGSDGMRGVCKY